MKNLAKVIESKGKWVTVVYQNQPLLCRLSGRLRQSKSDLTHIVAVGDWVGIENLDTDPLIISVEPRNNYIMRMATKASKQYHMLASNIDLMVILAPQKQPKTSTGFINRLLISAEIYQIPALIIFNKTDLLNEKEISELQLLTETYKKIGYSVKLESLKFNADEAEYKKEWHGQTVLLAGHSGAGKSTLINLLVPEANQKIGEVSERTQKGTHTTTFAKAIEIGANTLIIDTPGIREFGLTELEPEELGPCFPEIRSLIGQCKFNNCQHIHEPSCAVVHFFRNSPNMLFRYEDYLKIREEIKKK